MSVVATRNIEVKEYTEDLHTFWDQFIRTSSRNGGIFQERDFLSYHPKEKFNDASLLFFEEGDLIGVFPAAIIIDDGKKKVISHPGSSCGGLVYHKATTTSRVLTMLEMLIDHYQNKDVTSIEVRLAEPVLHQVPEGEFTYLLWHRGFKMKTQELSTCVQLDSESSWTRLGRKKNLTDIRKLERDGYVVKNISDTEKIYPIIEHNLTTKYNRKPTHTLEELKKLKETYPDRIHFYTVEINDKIAAVTVLFDVTCKAVHTFYIAQSPESANVNILPLLFYKIFEEYRRRGFDWYNFGISSRGQEIKWGMLEFKERLGGRGTTRQVWMLDDIGSYQKYNGSASFIQ